MVPGSLLEPPRLEVTRPFLGDLQEILESCCRRSWSCHAGDDDPVAQLPGALTPLVNRGQGIIDGEPPRDPPSAADGVEQVRLMLLSLLNGL